MMPIDLHKKLFIDPRDAVLFRDDDGPTDDERKKENLKHRMETMRDSNIAKYEMITVRSDGERVIIAQKLEQKRSNAQKWDIYNLRWNSKLEEFEYTGSTAGH